MKAGEIFGYFIAGTSPEKKIVPGTFARGGISRCFGTVRGMANQLPRLGKYLRVPARDCRRVFDFRVDVLFRRGVQHGFGGQRFADVETFSPLQFRADKISVPRRRAHWKNFRRQASANRRLVRGGEQLNLHEERH